MQTVLLHTKEVSEPSPKILIATTGTHGNNGAHKIAMLHLFAAPGPLDGPTWCMSYSENGKMGGCVLVMQAVLLHTEEVS